MKPAQVILVDENDNSTGFLEKIEAHKKGLLHRAFSIFIFNSGGEMLLQQRAMNKYHSGGLWTNACCGHPNPGEEVLMAAQRRLKEEMGFEVPLEKVFDFVYNTKLDNGLTEHEFDHVFAGQYNNPVNFNKEEVMDYCYKAVPEIKLALQIYPKQYTAWFHLAFSRIEDWWNNCYNN